MTRKPSALSERQFHRWFDVLPEPVLLLSGDGTVLATNASFSRLAGPKRVVGHSLTELTSAPADVVQKYVEACSDSKESVEGSFILTDAEGNPLSCRWEGMAVESNADLTERRVLIRLYPISKPAEDNRTSSPPDTMIRGIELQSSQLRRSEERLRLSLETGQMAIWEWDAESDSLAASPTLEVIRGRAYKPFRGTLEDYLKGIHSEDRERVSEAIHEAMEKGEKYRVEYRTILPNLTIRWAEDRGSPLFDDLGRSTGIVCITLPIDQRKQFEQQLRERLERLSNTEAQVRSVIETAVDGIITINEKGTVLTFNPAAERIFGYTANEIVGQSLGMLMPEPYRSQHPRYIKNYVNTGRGRIIGTEREMVGQRKDGAVFPMELGVSESRLEGRRYFTGIVRDITERKRAENVSHFLADASRSLATLVDYASTLQQVAYLAVPFFADWCTVHISHEDGSLRQLAAAHIDPEKFEVAQALGNGYPLALENPIGPARVFKTGKSELIEEIPESLIESVAEDEHHREILEHLGLRSYMGVPLSVRGKPFGVMSFFSADPKRKYDLTDLGMAEDLAHRASVAVENALLYSELREVDRRKDEFLAILAQELRNPLAPIQSSLEHLKTEDGDPEAVRVIERQVGHLVRIADDLLDVSRVMQGTVELHREVVPLGAAVQRAIDAVRPAIDAEGQELTAELPSESITVHADPNRLTQIVTNLLSNAYRSTGKGGHIWLAVHRAGDSAIISVKDDGPGISDDELPHAFELFSRRNGLHHRGIGGLGLALVRSLAEMHDGRVTVASGGEGKGSEFTVQLPVYESAGEGPTSPEGGPKGRRILIVEDNIGTAKILSRLLAKLGTHNVHMVHDGMAALEAAKNFQPEIVLLDIGLPRMNGFEVAKKLREQPEFRETVLVALTGYGTEEDRRRSASVGFDRHIVKPPSLDNLRQVLVHPKLARLS